MSLTRITTVERLHDYLDAALQLEHATIPPYLTALYSMRPGGNSDAYHVIRVVAVEEMLHLTLVANVYQAVGGTPDLTVAGFVPSYPAFLPDGEADFAVGLQRFSRDAIDTFLEIERPDRTSGSGAGPEIALVRPDDESRPRLPVIQPSDDDAVLHFYSIGDFYEEIRRGLVYLDDQLSAKGEKLFVGDPLHQITPDFYYSGGGEVVPVVDLDSAQAAIRLIAEQGEGHGGAIFDDEEELSHYYRFQQLVLGRYYQEGDEPDAPSGPELDVDWDGVYPVKANARLADYPEGSELRAAAADFNAFYKAFLGTLTRAYNGERELLIQAVGDMFRIRDAANRLMRNPIPGVDGLNAAPTFELDPEA